MRMGFIVGMARMHVSVFFLVKVVKKGCCIDLKYFEIEEFD